jgi:hypothetical protein
MYPKTGKLPNKAIIKNMCLKKFALAIDILYNIRITTGETNGSKKL